MSGFWKDQSGGTAIEYSLVASLISIAIVGALLTISGEITQLYQSIANHVSGVLR